MVAKINNKANCLLNMLWFIGKVTTYCEVNKLERKHGIHGLNKAYLLNMSTRFTMILMTIFVQFCWFGGKSIAWPDVNCPVFEGSSCTFCPSVVFVMHEKFVIPYPLLYDIVSENVPMITETSARDLPDTSYILEPCSGPRTHRFCVGAGSKGAGVGGVQVKFQICCGGGFGNGLHQLCMRVTI